MSAVLRLEQRETVVMDPLVSGDFAERAIPEAHAWRCQGCGLVWEKRWHAERCEERGHKSSFDQGPYGGTFVLNGVLQGNLRYYTRQAIRRDVVGGAS